MCYNTTGTHDVQHISVSSPHPGSITVTGNLVNNTNATGVLIVVSNSSDVQYIVDSPADLNVNVTLNVSTGGEYSVSVFALENGQPFPRVAALPRCVLVNRSNDEGTIMYRYILHVMLCVNRVLSVSKVWVM